MSQRPPGPGPGGDPMPSISGFDSAEIMSYLSDPHGIEELLKETTETGDSPAEICADLINGMRADTVRLATALGVDMEVERITPEITAEILAGTVRGDSGRLIELLAAEEDRRGELLRHVLDEAEYRRFEIQKREAMFSTPAEFDPSDDEI